jgi:hypothetical protein
MKAPIGGKVSQYELASLSQALEGIQQLRDGVTKAEEKAS